MFRKIYRELNILLVLPMEYYIEFQDGKIQVVSEKQLIRFIDDQIDEIICVKKEYRWNKTIFCMTLYTHEHDFSAADYTSHYKNLPKDKYGPNMLSAFDIEIIGKLNF